MNSLTILCPGPLTLKKMIGLGARLCLSANPSANCVGKSDLRLRNLSALDRAYNHFESNKPSDFTPRACTSPRNALRMIWSTVGNPS